MPPWQQILDAVVLDSMPNQAHRQTAMAVEEAEEAVRTDSWATDEEAATATIVLFQHVNKTSIT
jgi:hypothetical protein